MTRKDWLLGFFTSLLSIVLLPGLGLSQNAQSYVTGKVISATSKKPISSLLVVVYENGTVKGRSLTGDDGKYYIGYLNNKIYTITVEKNRQKIFTSQIRLPDNQNYNIEIRN
jgi:hypothetical protein